MVEDELDTGDDIDTFLQIVSESDLNTKSAVQHRRRLFPEHDEYSHISPTQIQEMVNLVQLKHMLRDQSNNLFYKVMTNELLL